MPGDLGNFDLHPSQPWLRESKNQVLRQTPFNRCNTGLVRPGLPQDSRFDLFEIYPTESPSVNALLFLELSLEQTVTKLSTKMMAR